ncbi:MAG: hypothetical protein DMG65_23630 [Candidatus Angelobacter sp. Gp1-AA117]|nr:MAG: hypothetical protein DMG65_23630 [Candidatus Angelobacter sp. Gp1-AA117]
MEFANIEWQPLSRTGFVAWLIFYAVILLFLAVHFGQLTLLDNIHLVTHEAGHLLFGWLGETLGLWGGTLLQLLVPALLAMAFVVRREIPGVAFCVLAFFHSLSGVAIYMSDALRQELPLVTVGAPADEAQHDWVRIFSQLGVLPHAIQIGNTFRLLAWIGMLATVAWLCWRYLQQERADTAGCSRDS